VYAFFFYDNAEISDRQHTPPRAGHTPLHYHLHCMGGVCELLKNFWLGGWDHHCRLTVRIARGGVVELMSSFPNSESKEEHNFYCFSCQGEIRTELETLVIVDT